MSRLKRISSMLLATWDDMEPTGEPSWESRMRRWREERDFADQELDLSPLPPGVFSAEEEWRNYLEIEFIRVLTLSTNEYTKLFIPFGTNHVYPSSKSALKVAMDIVQKNNKAYTRLVIYNRTRHGGRMLYSDNSHRKYYK